MADDKPHYPGEGRPVPMPAGLGLYLRGKRLEKGLTQWAVAHRIGYSSRRGVQDLERGRRLPNLRRALILCDLLDVRGDARLALLDASYLAALRQWTARMRSPCVPRPPSADVLSR